MEVGTCMGSIRFLSHASVNDNIMQYMYICKDAALYGTHLT